MERLVEMGLAVEKQLQAPLSEAEIDRFRDVIAARFLSDEFVEFLRLGPAWPVWSNEPENVFEDLDALSLSRAPQDRYALVYSPRWVLLGSEENVFIATTPEPARRSAVMLGDLSAPGHVWPMFPSLRSMLWFLVQVADRLICGDFADERGWMRSWFWDLLFPWSADNTEYEMLRDAAMRVERDRHTGWLWDAPPVWEAGWTLEWMTAVGIGDADMTGPT